MIAVVSVISFFLIRTEVRIIQNLTLEHLNSESKKAVELRNNLYQTESNQEIVFKPVIQR